MKEISRGSVNSRVVFFFFFLTYGSSPLVFVRQRLYLSKFITYSFNGPGRFSRAMFGASFLSRLL